MSKFKIYTKPNCPYCDKAKKLIEKNKGTYEEVVVGKDIDREAYLTRYYPRKTVPMIIDLGEDNLKLLHVGGYEELKLYYGK